MEKKEIVEYIICILEVVFTNFYLDFILDCVLESLDTISHS